MNKQEAIEIIEQSKIKIANRGRVIFKAGEIIVENVQVDYVPLEVVVNTIDQIHEPQKVVVPKFIADSIEYCKNEEGYGLLRAMDYCDEYNDTGEWLEHNQETFALAWLFGYEIEQEKLYTVELFNGQPLVEEKNILYFSSDLAASNAHVGKDKLEAAGFGWVFDCNGVKVVEVKND
ncbi:TPA: DUF1642 domain-containing protein [Streptococcus suis]|uniref:DUF1642 domain-containing protein n=2 Tax=Streptococcus suis TaxID=1307 RepID=UPI000427AF50|nr:DUF1642 domain-containing protein [Streptococcus suis]NQK38770.1 DUF1642 domain-containing protein [Streptococcus suis]HEM2900507.1 DUF1642 domain-containing protein [Streptococcus suis]HEM3204484.1 DUF1642 domain-containing protein [Streptococcus suis 93A]HEM3214754.1 DUF1642 domain-containing protein [Streptococcus suis]HEM4076386.1 DUF1642 domain-containing protein [Streptococcus suis]